MKQRPRILINSLVLKREVSKLIIDKKKEYVWHGTKGEQSKLNICGKEIPVANTFDENFSHASDWKAIHRLNCILQHVEDQPMLLIFDDFLNIQIAI